MMEVHELVPGDRFVVMGEELELISCTPARALVKPTMRDTRTIVAFDKRKGEDVKRTFTVPRKAYSISRATTVEELCPKT